MKVFELFLFILLFFSWITVLHPQTISNPDISVIPRFRMYVNDGDFLPDRRIWNRPDFMLEEFELGIQAYLNPFARGDVFLSKAGFEDEPIEIEEAYVTFLRDLPFDLNVKVGKYRTDFGKLNSLHPHAWSFITQPASQERFLGEESINDLGISASLLLPTDNIYSKITLDLLRGHSIGVLNPDDESMHGGPGIADTNGTVYYANSGRVMVFFPTSENSDLEFGLSELTGIHDPYNHYRFFYTNFDFKYKWKPDMYRSFTLQGELLLNNRRIAPDENLSTNGFFLFGNYQFQKSFTAGIRLDWSESPYSKDDRSKGFAVFLGYYPVEETTALRLQFQHDRLEPFDSQPRDVNTIALQLMFSIGPHKAHQF
jgi:hypothetical protein